MSGTFASPSIRFVELPPELDQGWHHAPARQIVVLLQGRMEVGTSDGQKKQWGAGTAVIADDLTGKGHVTRGGRRPGDRDVRATAREFRRRELEGLSAPRRGNYSGAEQASDESVNPLSNALGLESIAN